MRKKKKLSTLQTWQILEYRHVSAFQPSHGPNLKAQQRWLKIKRTKHSWWQEVPSSVPSECTSWRQQSFAAGVLLQAGRTTNFSSMFDFPRQHPPPPLLSFILALSHRLFWRHESQWNEPTVAAWWEACVKMCMYGARRRGREVAVALMLPYVGFTVSHFNDAYSSSETAVVHSSI